METQRKSGRAYLAITLFFSALAVSGGRAEEGTLSNSGHYMVGPYEFFAEEPAYIIDDATGKSRTLNSPRPRIFVMPMLSVLKAECGVFVDGQKITSVEELDTKVPTVPPSPPPVEVLPPGGGKMAAPPPVRQETKVVAKPSLIDARLVFRITSAPLDDLAKYVIAGQLENWPIGAASRLAANRFDEEGGVGSAGQDGGEQAGSGNGGGESDVRLDFTTFSGLQKRLLEYRFEVNAPQSVEVSVYCMGGNPPEEMLIGRTSLGSNAYLGTSSTIAVDCPNITKVQAKYLLQGYFSAVANMRVALSMSQFGFAHVTTKKVGELIIENIANASVTKQEKKTGFLFWSSVKKSLESAANAESVSNTTEARSADTTVVTRDADSELISRLLEQFLFNSRENASTVDVRQLMAQHEAAAKVAADQGNQVLSNTHATYAAYLKSLLSESAPDADREAKADAALQALQSLAKQPADGAQGAVGEGAAAGMATGNPWVGVAVFLAKGIAFKNDVNSATFSMKSLQKSSWNDSDERRMSALLNNQVARMFTVTRGDFPIIRGTGLAAVEVKDARAEMESANKLVGERKTAETGGPVDTPTPTPSPSPTPTESPSAG